MIYLRQSTASQEVPLGRFVDSTDGNTEETALSIANTDIKIWKTGATTLASKNSGGATHIANGVYYAVLDATDTDTIGPLVIHIHVSGALYVKQDCCVLDEAVYDVVFGTTAPATATNITAGTITTVTNLTNAPTNGDLTATMKTSVTTAATAATPTAAAVTGAVGSVTGNVGGNVVGSVASVTAGVTLANGAHGGTSATLRLGGSTSTPAFYVTNSGGDAVQFEATGGNGIGFDILGNGSGHAMLATGGATGDGLRAMGGATSGDGAHFQATTQGRGMHCILGGTGFSITAALIEGDLSGSVNSVAAGGIDAASLTPDAGAEIGTAVWATAARTLTAATNITSTGGTTVPQTGDAYAIVNSGTHGNAALKTLIDTVDTVVDAILADTSTDGVAISSSVREAIATSLLDLAAGVETNRTLRQALRLILAASAGKLSGAATTTVTIRDTNDTTNRIVATVDADGNRSAVTLSA